MIIELIAKREKKWPKSIGHTSDRTNKHSNAAHLKDKDKGKLRATRWHLDNQGKGESDEEN